jgi:hypothetical protein
MMAGAEDWLMSILPQTTITQYVPRRLNNGRRTLHLGDNHE